jgi:Arabidopsis protein of unknown function
MIPGFNRSISLPLNSKPKAQSTYHVRSVSLPSQSHHLISHLEEQIQALQTRFATSDGCLASIEAGLSQIELLQSALNEFLNFSESKIALQRGTASMEHLLDNLLYLVDLYGSFLSAMVTLKQQIFEVQSAFRRCDSGRLLSSLKSQRKTEKELSRLVSSLRVSMKPSPVKLECDAMEAKTFWILKEAIFSTSAATLHLMNRVVAVSTAASTAAASSASNRILLFTKKVSKEDREVVSYQKLKELEEFVKIVESGSDKVFRSLINSRVSLLNIQSDSF